MSEGKCSECIYKAEGPYPKVQVKERNAAYAREMLSNMADIASEISDVSRYFYIAVMTAPKYGEISECFHNISIVEMHHLNIFAELARQLGADPRLWCVKNGRRRWWSPSYVGYPQELRAMIAESVKAEKDAVIKYSRQAKVIEDMNIVENLHRIIKDEECHLQTFQEMYDQL
ncbi:ferritin-like domain-containing protein [Ruminococcus gauvreauii]|uniref:Rubrerythrin n=1 Tax=Ruminococcus gauvreauii TaxID=438033 RepID=A0ABY5VDH5_9FIRM|nr:ferritin family protein [Ruminococcus gauvreauii]UWP58634.1 rubrerythrin [Ruminococcus gauvreauii]